MLTAANIEREMERLARANPQRLCRRCGTGHYLRERVACAGAVVPWFCEGCRAVNVTVGRPS